MMPDRLQAGGKPQGLERISNHYQPHLMLQSTLHLLLVGAIALLTILYVLSCSGSQSSKSQGTCDAIVRFCMIIFSMPVAKSITT